MSKSQGVATGNMGRSEKSLELMGCDVKYKKKALRIHCLSAVPDGDTLPWERLGGAVLFNR